MKGLSYWCLEYYIKGGLLGALVGTLVRSQEKPAISSSPLVISNAFSSVEAFHLTLYTGHNNIGIC